MLAFAADVDVFHLTKTRNAAEIGQIQVDNEW
jgi:hypothetical protein